MSGNRWCPRYSIIGIWVKGICVLEPPWCYHPLSPRGTDHPLHVGCGLSAPKEKSPSGASRITGCFTITCLESSSKIKVYRKEELFSTRTFQDELEDGSSRQIAVSFFFLNLHCSLGTTADLSEKQPYKPIQRHPRYLELDVSNQVPDF